MARNVYTDKHEDDGGILIERREYVGRVSLSSKETQSPIMAAFAIVGEYFDTQPQDSAEPIRVVFTFGGHAYAVTREPTP